MDTATNAGLYQQGVKGRGIISGKSKLAELVEKQDEFIKLLGEECRNMAAIASIHGWKSVRYQQGVKLRDEIKVLRQQIEFSERYYTDSFHAKAREMANTIRHMTFGCKSKDVMSCKFGNEFGDRVEEFLRQELQNLFENV